MMIAIASDDGINVAANPAHCNGFVVFEIEETSAVRVGYRSNGSTDGAEGAAGEDGDSDPAQACRSIVAVLSDCTALVSGNADDSLRRELLRCGMDVLVACEESVDQAAQGLIGGRAPGTPR